MAKHDDVFVLGCYQCGVIFHDVAQRRSQVRAKAKAEGWSVAIPEWAIQNPPVTQEAWWLSHPKGITVDICPLCVSRSMERTMSLLDR